MKITFEVEHEISYDADGKPYDNYWLRYKLNNVMVSEESWANLDDIKRYLKYQINKLKEFDGSLAIPIFKEKIYQLNKEES